MIENNNKTLPRSVRQTFPHRPEIRGGFLIEPTSQDKAQIAQIARSAESTDSKFFDGSNSTQTFMSSSRELQSSASDADAPSFGSGKSASRGLGRSQSLPCSFLETYVLCDRMCFYVFLCLRYFIHIIHLFTHVSSVSLQRHHRVSDLNHTNTRNKECILFDRTKGSLLNLKRSSRATRLRKRSTNKAVHQGNAHKNLNRRCSCYDYDESTFFSSKRNALSVRKGWSTETTNHITF